MSAGRMRRVLGAVIGLALLTGVAFVPQTPQTEAAFTDSEHVTGAFTAATLATPTVTNCTITNNILGAFQSVTLTWASPHDKPHQTLTVRNTATGTTSVVAPANITQSGPSGGPWTYSSTLSATLLLGLLDLGSLLGLNAQLTVAATAGANWTSQQAGRTLRVGLLGGLLGSTCT